MRPHSRQPTRLLRPWDSPGKNTGVGCHFLLQCKKVKHESEVAQSCQTLSDPMDCSLPRSSVHGSFQARVLEWVAINARCWEFAGSSAVKTWCFHYCKLGFNPGEGTKIPAVVFKPVQFQTWGQPNKNSDLRATDLRS